MRRVLTLGAGSPDLDHSKLWLHTRRKAPAHMLSGTTEGLQMLALTHGPCEMFTDNRSHISFNGADWSKDFFIVAP